LGRGRHRGKDGPTDGQRKRKRAGSGDTVETLRPVPRKGAGAFKGTTSSAAMCAKAVDAGRAAWFYGDLSKAKNGLTKSATKLATDKDGARQAKPGRRASPRADRTRSRARPGNEGRAMRRKRSGRALLWRGVVRGRALPTRWTGQSTRDWLLDKDRGVRTTSHARHRCVGAGTWLRQATALRPTGTERSRSATRHRGAGGEGDQAEVLLPCYPLSASPL